MNPTKQEIASWLQELAEWFEGIAGLSNQSCFRELNLKRAEVWANRAALVEASTDGLCESCQFWMKPQSLKLAELRTCKVLSIPCTPGFGCIHHKVKKPRASQRTGR